MSHEETMIDLVPAEYRSRQQLRTRALAWAVVAATIGCMLVLIASSMGAKVQALDAQLRPLREGVQGMNRWADKLSPLASQLKIARARQLVVNRLLHEPYWSGLLSDVTNASTDSVWFTQIRLSKDTVSVEGVTEDVVSFSVTGTAASNLEVIGFMTRVSDSPHIQSLRLESSKVRREGPNGRPILDFDVRGTVQWQ